MAITGNSARLHAQENSYLPLLYNFEELEGEINFLTRIVALTFYPSVPGRTPLTLGEIEVLGVSLPWMDIFAKNTNGAKFITYSRETHKCSTSIHCASDINNSTNPSPRDSNASRSHDAFSSSSRVVQSAQPSAVSHGIDLLTGDMLFSDSSSQPERSSVAEGTVPSNERIVDCFDTKQFAGASNLPDQECGGNNIDDSIGQCYIDLFKSFSTSNRGNQLDFLQAMKLEIERLRLNLSAAERDKALLSVSIDPASIDPNRLLDDLYMVRVCNYAGNLALLGQTAFEDRIIASSGLDIQDNDVIDFWNISNFGETCSGAKCEVQTEVQIPVKASSNISSTGSLPLLLECSQCGRKTCKVCCAGKGASLLLSSNYKDMKIYNGGSNQSGSNHGGLEKTYSGQFDLQDGVICKSCCSEVILHALYVDYARVLSSLRRQTRADSAAYRAVDQVVGHNFDRISNSSQDQKIVKNVLKKLLNGEESLAEFPYAGLLHLVETAPSSQPLLSLLAPLGIGEKHSYWRAPSSSSTVEFSILLGGLSDVSGVAMLVSSCGYSTSDCPMVQIWASNKINREERSCMGRWDIQSLISSSPHLCGQEKASGDDDVPRHVKFHFRNPVRCRIIWITITLPQTCSLLEEQYNLLSLDDSSFPKSNNASFGSTVKHEPFIHAKRILVFGYSVKSDISQGASLQNTEIIKMRSYLDRSPQLGRFRVPIEGERLTDNDLVLEQYPSPNITGLAGFRLDAFSVIKPRITHSPSSLDVDIWQSSLTHLEDRHISPALLYIQVSAVQEPRNYVTVGEYRLPEVRAGTSLYFDFPRPIQARRLIFRLLGDVAAFADDIVEQDDSNFRANPLASGLSLSNRIKLYYYADPYELGKLASLSAV
ncbi:putative phosphoinositide phosphatase SAC9 [Iris pallida]|uniref:Phosphoinositide phosphatase SAC9 n=1 Tax=Iris pallida TaxID=29817 RepID=A0AAX6G8L6_IRIPA|nr:putative phosphoinositide phosphatase SAC9 [Iris pallida]